MQIVDLKDGGDWYEALLCAARDGTRGVIGYNWSTVMFDVDDIAEVLASADGENDGASWIAALRLHDGRFALMSAWCDYTGWGCRDGGDVQFAASLADLVRLAMTTEDRARLGYPPV